jgi:protein arginine N-methyltransferase 1
MSFGRIYLKSLLRRLLLALINLIKRILAANPRMRVLLYNLHNRQEFTDLYEHEKMLADTVRIDTYKKGIERHVHPGDTVLDLGTGTGILSFFAAQQKAKKIYAVDHSAFIAIAAKVAKKNNFGNIEFVKCHSRNFKSAMKIDVLIHEQIGDYLFNENMIQNILDLRDRVLKPGGRIIPGKFELFLEPTCLKRPFNVPFIWENTLHGIDFTFLATYYEELEQYKPSDYRQEWIKADAIDHFLCQASPVLEFDLNELVSEKDIPRTIDVSRQLVRPGSFDGICMFFKVIFDEETQFETSPLTTHTHWGNCFFRIESRQCQGDETVKYTLNMPDLLDIKKWSVSIKRFQDKVPTRA